MSKTKIEWSEYSWNPVRGCSIVSEGCRNCYAMRQAHRYSKPGMPFEGYTKMTPTGPKWTGKVQLLTHKFQEPLSWTTPKLVFVNSMSDLFHEDLPDKAREAVFLTMAACAEESELRKTKNKPVHTFQVLTKRPEVMARFLAEHKFPSGKTLSETPLSNVWLGTSIEDQPSADRRGPIIAGIEWPMLWISAEPLIDDIRFGSWMEKMKWVVVGGESGPGARWCHLSWIRSVIRQCHCCEVVRVPVFVKQLGACPIHNDNGLKLKSSKGGDMSEWPEDLRIREYPA